MIGYNPTNWASGDVITSEKLNKLEKGVANYSFEITLTLSGGNWTSNLSYDQIAAILDENDEMSRAIVTKVERGKVSFIGNMLVYMEEDGIHVVNTPYSDSRTPTIGAIVDSDPKYIVYTMPETFYIHKSGGVDVVEHTYSEEYFSVISENPPE